MGAARHVSAAGFLAVLCTLGCQCEPAGDASIAPPSGREVEGVVEPERLDIVIGGCAYMLSDGTCELSEGQPLRAWVPSRTATLEVNGKAIKAEVEPKEGRFVVSAPVDMSVPGAKSVRIVVDGRAKTFSVTAPTYPADLARLTALRTPATMDAFREAIDAIDSESRTALDRARLDVWKAKLAFSSSKTDEVIAAYGRALPVLRAHGRVSEAAQATGALVYTLTEQALAYDKAMAALDAWTEEEARADELSRALLNSFRGLLLARLGDLGEALDVTEQATRVLGALDAPQTAFSRMTLAWIHSRLGRHQDAERISLMDIAALEPCERALALMNLAWFRMNAGDHGEAQTRRPLLEARTLYRAECPHEYQAGNIELSLAEEALARGAVDEAEAHLDEAAGHDDTDESLVAQARTRVHASALMRSGKPRQAKAELQSLAARSFLSPEEHPKVLISLARALLALRETNAAIETLTQADALVDEQLRSVSLSMGRDTLAAHHFLAARLLTDLLADAGRVEDALRTALHAHNRHLTPFTALMDHHASSGEARATQVKLMSQYAQLQRKREALSKGRWSASEEELERRHLEQEELASQMNRLLSEALPSTSAYELPTPKKGVLTLYYVEGEHGVHGFARSTAGLQHVFFRGAREDGQQDFLAPFDEALGNAEEVHAFGTDSLPLNEPFHLAPFRGVPLIQSRPVAYALGLPTVTRDGARSHAALVIDPRNNLPHARAEGRALYEQSPDAHLLKGEQATREEVTALLGSVETLHYAGHASFDDARWWESGLLLAADTVLSIRDILALKTVPRSLTLSACESGRQRQLRVASVGIAQAFILRGARHVVSPTENVGDKEAARFMRAYYAAKTSNPVERAQVAFRTLRDAGLSPSDIPDFRVFVP